MIFFDIILTVHSSTRVSISQAALRTVCGPGSLPTGFF